MTSNKKSISKSKIFTALLCVSMFLMVGAGCSQLTDSLLLDSSAATEVLPVDEVIISMDYLLDIDSSELMTEATPDSMVNSVFKTAAVPNSNFVYEDLKTYIFKVRNQYFYHKISTPFSFNGIDGFSISWKAQMNMDSVPDNASRVYLLTYKRFITYYPYSKIGDLRSTTVYAYIQYDSLYHYDQIRLSLRNIYRKRGHVESTNLNFPLTNEMKQIIESGEEFEISFVYDSDAKEISVTMASSSIVSTIVQSQDIDYFVFSTIKPAYNSSILSRSDVFYQIGNFVYPIVNQVSDFKISDTVQTNQPPVANAGANQIVECAGSATQFQLDGSLSTDPDNDALTYSWTGPFGTVTGVSPVVNFNLHGNHVVTLTVTDLDGAESTDTVEITIQDTTPPVITAELLSVDQKNKNKGLFEVRYSISDICDANPTITSALLNGIPVDNGTLVMLKNKNNSKDFKSKVKQDYLEFKSDSFILEVVGVDASGNENAVQVSPTN